MPGLPKLVECNKRPGRISGAASHSPTHGNLLINGYFGATLIATQCCKRFCRPNGQIVAPQGNFI